MHQVRLTMTNTIRVATVAALVLTGSLLAAGPAAASDASLAGTVTVRVNGAPLAGVCVRLNPAAPSCATFTDVNGAYFIDLSGAPNGILWEIQYEKGGYQTG